MVQRPDLRAGEPKQAPLMSEGSHPADCAPGPTLHRRQAQRQGTPARILIKLSDFKVKEIL